MSLMNKTAERITTYNFTSSDKLLLDTNIWIYIYGPQKPNDKWVTIYSEALKKILKAKSYLYIDVLVVSEFINTYARKIFTSEFNHIYKSYEFKKFRQSAHFKPFAQDIGNTVKRILSICERIANGFESFKVDFLINEYAAGNSDFNDQILIELCKKAKLKLITHDCDFKNKGLSLITAQKELLRPYVYEIS